MMLSHIKVTPLRRIETPGGDVMHAMKQSDDGYIGFGEAYFSRVSCGAVKAWKRHTRMTMNLVVPIGLVRFVFHAKNRMGTNEFRVEDIGESCYARITVPAGIWFGFQGRSEADSLVLNFANIEHDPNEVERLDMYYIDYDWDGE